MQLDKILLVFLLTLLLGCGGNEVASPSDADIEAASAGVGNEAQIQFFITEELKLTSIDLTPSGDGNYTAKGSDAKSATYEITVDQQPGKINYAWKNSKGKKGKRSIAY